PAGVVCRVGGAVVGRLDTVIGCGVGRRVGGAGEVVLQGVDGVVDPAAEARRVEAVGGGGHELLHGDGGDQPVLQRLQLQAEGVAPLLAARGFGRLVGCAAGQKVR